jgi:hypothetical protein
MPQVTVNDSWVTIIVGAFSAAGTLTLAFFTWRLAGSTRADVEAQWQPLLVPAERIVVDGMGMTTTEGWAELTPVEQFLFCFKNIGKGAAIDVRGLTRNGPADIVLYGNCDDLPSPVVAVEGRADFRRVAATIDQNRVRAMVTYEDLAGNSYETTADYVRVSSNVEWRVEFVVPTRPVYLSGLRLLLLRLGWWVSWPLRGAKRGAGWIGRRFSRAP